MRSIVAVIFLSFARVVVAQDTVKVAVPLTPEQSAEIEYNKGLTLITKQDYRGATEVLTKAITLLPSYEKAYAARAVAYSHQKKYQDALIDINTAIKANPTDADHYFNKSLI